MVERCLRDLYTFKRLALGLVYKSLPETDFRVLLFSEVYTCQEGQYNEGDESMK